MRILESKLLIDSNNFGIEYLDDSSTLPIPGTENAI